MRYIGLGDVHFKPTYHNRIDDVKRAFENKFEQIHRISTEIKADAIICTGDWLEDKNPYNCSPGFLVWIMGILRSLEIPVYSIVGNHDIRNNDLGTLQSQPLGVLMLSGCVTRIGKDTPNILGYDYGANLKEELADKTVGLGKIGVFHCYSADKEGSMFGNEIVYPLSIFASTGFDHVLNGHDHQHYDLKKVGDTWVHRPGAIFRMRRDEVDLTRKVCVTTFGSDILPQYRLLEHRPSAEVFDMKTKQVFDTLDANISTFVKSLSDIRSLSPQPIEEKIKNLDLPVGVLGVINDSLDKAKQND